MPHRTSLVRQLADLRRQYTGETDTTVLPAAVHACKLLDTGERLLLAHNLDRNYASRLLGEEVDPLPPDLRAAVLPDANTSCQRELEADVLLAAGRAVEHLHPLPALARNMNLKPGRVFRMVRHQGDGLVLHLERTVLGPLLLELLPRTIEDGTVTGVPGLRAALHRRHVVLHLLHAKAEVTLAALSYRQWIAALDFVEAFHGDQANPLRWLGNDAPPLTAQELTALLERRRTPGLLRVASAVLRRVGLFAAATELQVVEDQPSTLHLKWHGGPTAAAVATALVHPITGLRGDRFFVVPQAKQVIVRSLTDDVFVILEQLPDPVAPVAPPAPEVVAAWKAWNTRMWAPNPCWPTAVLRQRSTDDDDVELSASTS